MQKRKCAGTTGQKRYSRPALRPMGRQEVVRTLRNLLPSGGLYPIDFFAGFSAGDSSSALAAAFRALRLAGHQVAPRNHAGATLFEIDGSMLATENELRDLGSEVLRWHAETAVRS